MMDIREVDLLNNLKNWDDSLGPYRLQDYERAKLIDILERNISNAEHKEGHEWVKIND